MSLAPSQFQVEPAQTADYEEPSLPITSYTCKWKVPRKRKESNMKISEAQFEKHVYGRLRTKTMESTEDLDPRPLECRGQAVTNLATFMKKVKGRNLGVSLLLDPSTLVWTEKTSEAPTIISTEQLRRSMAAFKESLKLPTSELRRIERDTRDQSRSSLWFSQRKYRITASFFGEIFKRLPSTPPHHLVLRIIDPKPFN